MHLTLQGLLNQLQSSIQGDLSPSFIYPAELPNVLISIRSKLPNNVKLPYPIDRHGLLLYYQYIKPMVVPADDSFHVVMAIPLIHTDTEYEIHRAVQVPIPLGNDGLGASYSLESQYLAMSRDKNHFILLEQNDVTPCLQSPVCKFFKPQLSVVNYPQCITSLLLHDAHRTQSNCKRIISKSTTPTIKHLYPRNYLVSTFQPFTVNVHCNDRSYSQEIKNLEILKLEVGCSTSSDYFSIQEQTIGDTSVEQQVKFDAEIEISKLSTNIWNGTNEVFKLFSKKDADLDKIINELPKVQDIPIEYFHRMQTEHHKN